MRLITIVLTLAVIATACTSSDQDSTGGTEPVTSATTGAPSTTSPPNTTSTTQPAVTTTESPRPAESFVYAIVAEERSRRLAVIDPASPCTGCGPITTVELPERPHNLAGLGSVVYATHPAAGSISRVDLATGDVLTSAVGTEPHDIKLAGSSNGEVLYVADEAGGRFLTLDPVTLEVIQAVELPGEPHDLAVAGGAAWVTLIGRDELALVEDGQVELVRTGGSPHDLIVDPSGRVWFTNWNSDLLIVFDPDRSTTVEAPAGVVEPHHFAIASDGTVWVSGNGGSAVVGFTEHGPRAVEVGPTPHHLAFAGDVLVVAVSANGEAVLVENEVVVGRVQLTPGLHGVALVTLERELTAVDQR